MDDLLKGRRLAAVVNESEKFIFKREEALIAEMVSRYRTMKGDIEAQWIVGKVAEISAGRFMIAEMRRELSQLEGTNG